MTPKVAWITSQDWHTCTQGHTSPRTEPSCTCVHGNYVPGYYLLHTLPFYTHTPPSQWMELHMNPLKWLCSYEILHKAYSTASDKVNLLHVCMLACMTVSMHVKQGVLTPSQYWLISWLSSLKATGRVPLSTLDLHLNLLPSKQVLLFVATSVQTEI